MHENNSQKNRRPTLEQLFELKKTDVTDAAFWERFDKGLRQKQLAALVRPTRTSVLKPERATIFAFLRWTVPVAAVLTIAGGIFWAERTPTPLTASQEMAPQDVAIAMAPTTSVAPKVVAQISEVPVVAAVIEPVAPKLSGEPQEIGPTIEPAAEVAAAALPEPTPVFASSVVVEPLAPTLLADVAPITFPKTEDLIAKTVSETPTDSWKKGEQIKTAVIADISPRMIYGEPRVAQSGPRKSQATRDISVSERDMEIVSARWDYTASHLSIKF